MLKVLVHGMEGNHALGRNPTNFSRAMLTICQKIIHQTNLQSNQLPQLINVALEQVQARKIPGRNKNIVESRK